MGTASTLPDFDALVAFYEQDPAGYEQFRLQLLNNAVAAAPARHRPALNGVLHQIEFARQAAKSPLEAALAAQMLLSKSLNELHTAWHKLQWRGAKLETTLVIYKLQTSARPQ